MYIRLLRPRVYTGVAMESLFDQIGNTLLEHRAFRDNPLTEELLATRFGMSRTPIRTALLELEMQHIIVRKQRKGLYLRTPSRREIDELFRVRAVLEELAARTVAETAEQPSILELREIALAHLCAHEEGRHLDAMQLDAQFHQKVAMLADNQVLTRILKSFAISQRAWLLFQTPREAPPRTLNKANSHVSIADRLVDHDALGAGSRMKRHILRDRDLLFRCVSFEH